LKRKNRKKRDWWTGKIRSLDVGERLRLVPYWERGHVPSQRIELIIDPGPAFGAGDHPTTIMALELMESAIATLHGESSSPNMLDVGTGTGVLAIAGMALGIGESVALDIDAAAIFTARRNFTLNGCGSTGGSAGTVLPLIGGVESVKGSFHLVAANLAAPVLLRLREHIVPRVGRMLILSGIAEALAEEVFSLYGSDDVELLKRIEKDGWHAGLLRRTESGRPPGR
jgi:ribosomal protein L11 methyltransferase